MQVTREVLDEIGAGDVPWIQPADVTRRRARPRVRQIAFAASTKAHFK
jgi:hypothetical protein